MAKIDLWMQKYGGNMFNRFSDLDFLFDLQYIKGSISNRQGSAQGRFSAIGKRKINATEHVCDETGSRNMAACGLFQICRAEDLAVYAF